MLQTLEATGYTCNRPRFLLHNSSDNVELPMPVENCRCSKPWLDALSHRWPKLITFLTDFNSLELLVPRKLLQRFFYCFPVF